MNKSLNFNILSGWNKTRQLNILQVESGPTCRGMILQLVWQVSVLSSFAQPYHGLTFHPHAGICSATNRDCTYPNAKSGGQGGGEGGKRAHSTIIGLNVQASKQSKKQNMNAICVLPLQVRIFNFSYLLFVLCFSEA